MARELAFMEYGHRKGLKRFVTVPVNRIQSSYYLEEKSYKGLLKNLLNEVLSHWPRHLNEYLNKRKALIEKAQTVKKRTVSASCEELWKFYDQCYKAQFDFNPYIYMPYALLEFCEQKIQQKFTEHYEIITNPDKPSEFQKMQFILSRAKPEVVAKKYDWLNVYSLNEKPYSVSYFKKLKKKLDKKDLVAAKKQLRENQRKFKKFLKLIRDYRLRKILLLMHEYAFIRTDRADAWRKFMSLMQLFFEELIKRINQPGWTLAETINLSREEIKQILLYNKIPLLREMKLRSAKKCIIDYRGGKLFFVYDRKQIEKIKKMVKPPPPKVKEIPGVIANKGKVQGRVAVVTQKEDLNKIKRGAILVAVVTEPSYAPYMKKCRAVVTDEGCITCHAAIVSRELGIPCLIGTKVATKVLRDGDLVEVDAERGIVRKIK